MRLVRALDRSHRVTMAPFQQPGVAAAHGLTIAQCEAAAWAITPDQQRYPAAAAVNLTLAVAVRTRLPLWLYAIPGVRQLQDSAYAWVARNRSRLPGDTPYCEQHPDQCRSTR
jgi:predicted DCC family thiol-disulfide oxidoreductase YuxK